MKLNLYDVLDWAYLDVEKLEWYLEIASRLGISIDDVKEEIEEFNGDTSNINNWFYAVIELIFWNVTNKLFEQTDDENLKYEIETMQDNFSPYINYMDSWFDNDLDNIDWDNVDNLDEAVDELANILYPKIDKEKYEEANND